MVDLTRIALAGLLAASATRISATAQAPGTSPDPRVPVTLVLMPADLAGQPFIVQRSTTPTPHDLIFLGSGASADDLSDAIASLLVIRQSSGDLPSASATLRVHRPPAAATAHRRPFPWAHRVLNDLHHAKRSPVAGIGDARSVVIYLPSHRPGWNHYGSHKVRPYRSIRRLSGFFAILPRM
jgi:hypothetical protein